MLFAIFILLHKNEQVRTLSSLVVNMFLKSDLSFPETGKVTTPNIVPEVKCFDRTLTCPNADSSKSQFQVL